MVTPILFDIATIIGLRQTGKTFNPNESDEDTIIFDANHVSFRKDTNDYHVTETTKVSDEEHIAFLALWLSM